MPWSIWLTASTPRPAARMTSSERRAVSWRYADWRIEMSISFIDEEVSSRRRQPSMFLATSLMEAPSAR